MVPRVHVDRVGEPLTITLRMHVIPISITHKHNAMSKCDFVHSVIKDI